MYIIAIFYIIWRVNLLKKPVIQEFKKIIPNYLII
ncbi:MAG: hypothetical protein MRERV_17c016 [Mycoplasmataceae bacterium RV_VA103A]|nr:MAG: hypothetical protein MRERV_17c016 [Mycoplasmataceae bacterium RV_VA103A]